MANQWKSHLFQSQSPSLSQSQSQPHYDSDPPSHSPSQSQSQSSSPSPGSHISSPLVSTRSSSTLFSAPIPPRSLLADSFQHHLSSFSRNSTPPAAALSASGSAASDSQFSSSYFSRSFPFGLDSVAVQPAKARQPIGRRPFASTPNLAAAPTTSSDAPSPELFHLPISPQIPTNSFQQSAGGSKPMLYKTELCRSWKETVKCSYGTKCRYAHGPDEQRDRFRQPTFRTFPCADSSNVRAQNCPYGSRCNYVHPGQEVRKILSGWTARLKQNYQAHQQANPQGNDGVSLGDGTYIDQHYFEILKEEFPGFELPFGIFI